MFISKALLPVQYTMATIRETIRALWYLLSTLPQPLRSRQRKTVADALPEHKPDTFTRV